MQVEEVEVAWLYEQNASRAWVKHLEDCYSLPIYGKDFDTIDYWTRQFRAGSTSRLTVDSTYVVTDGHHRLIAAMWAGLDTIEIVVCPQRTTYR